MEQFDILNRQGDPTGVVADKGTLLKDGEYYLGVHAYIYNPSNRFLLQRRAFDKDFLPGGWDIHMGHVIAGETAKEGMIREINEEIGLSLSETGLRHVGTVVREEYHHLMDIFFSEADFSIEDLVLQDGEVIGVKTVSIEEMVHLVSNMDYRPAEYRRIVLDEIERLNAERV